MPTPREIVNKLLEDYSGFLNGNGQPHGEPDDQGDRGEPGGDGDGQPDGPPDGPPEPEQPTITIGEIFKALPPGVDDAIIKILNAENDIIRMAKRLKEILHPHAAALEKIGVVADYAAYMLVAVAQRMRGL